MATSHEEVDADAPRDVDQLGVERVAVDDPGPSADSSIAAPCRLRIISTPAQPGATALRPPEKPAIRCGSISPVIDLEIGADVAAVDPDLGAALGAPEMHVLVGVARVVVADAIARRRSPGRSSPPARRGCWHGADRWRRGSRCARARCRRASRARSSGGSTIAVRHRPGLVGDHHDGVAPPARQLGQRRRADRRRQRLLDRAARIGQRRALGRLEDRDLEIVGEIDVEPRAPMVETNLHAPALAQTRLDR